MSEPVPDDWDFIVHGVRVAIDEPAITARVGQPDVIEAIRQILYGPSVEIQSRSQMTDGSWIQVAVLPVFHLVSGGIGAPPHVSGRPYWPSAPRRIRLADWRAQFPDETYLIIDGMARPDAALVASGVFAGVVCPLWFRTSGLPWSAALQAFPGVAAERRS